MSGRWRCGTLLILAILLGAPGARAAGKPSCRECEWRQCVERTIAQKKALKQIYDGLAAAWAKKGPSADVLDLEKIRMAARRAAISDLRKKTAAFQREEEKATNRVAAPAGCGLPPDIEIEMETDSTFCKIDVAKADRARELLPCRELGEIAFRHEALHLQRCLQRKGDRAAPAKLLTPAGKAREESAAYAQEIAELEKLLADGTIEITARVLVRNEHGGVLISTQGMIPFMVDELGRIKGTAEQSVSATPSPLRCSITLGQTEVRYDVGGTTTGEKLRLFSLSPAVPAVKATFHCPEGDAQGLIPYHSLTRLDIENKDKAKVELDLTRLTGGLVQGKALYTLLCAVKPRP